MEMKLGKRIESMQGSVVLGLSTRSHGVLFDFSFSFQLKFQLIGFGQIIS